MMKKSNRKEKPLTVDRINLAVAIRDIRDAYDMDYLQEVLHGYIRRIRKAIDAAPVPAAVKKKWKTAVNAEFQVSAESREEILDCLHNLVVEPSVPIFEEWTLAPALPLSDWERFWLAVSDFWEKLRGR